MWSARLTQDIPALRHSRPMHDWEFSGVVAADTPDLHETHALSACADELILGKVDVCVERMEDESALLFETDRSRFTTGQAASVSPGLRGPSARANGKQRID